MQQPKSSIIRQKTGDAQPRDSSAKTKHVSFQSPVKRPIFQALTSSQQSELTSQKRLRTTTSADNPVVKPLTPQDQRKVIDKLKKVTNIPENAMTQHESFDKALSQLEESKRLYLDLASQCNAK